jgi:methyl-accepting chemotaxis protein
VRALAQRSAQAAKEIKGLISTSTAQVDQGVLLVTQTGEALGRIVAQVVEINGVIADIAASAQEQATGLQQVNTAVNEMDQVTQKNAAMVEETTAAAHALDGQIEELGKLTARYKIRGVAEDPIRRELKKAAPHAFREAPKTAASAERPAAAAVRPEPVRRAAVKAAVSGSDEGWHEF